MFTLFFVVVRKGYCLPQNVGVVSVSLTGVHPHMKLGGDIDFGDAQGIGILKFW